MEGTKSWTKGALKLQSYSHFDNLTVSLEHSLWILHKYIKDEAEKELSLDQVLVPMIEHVRKFET